MYSDLGSSQIWRTLIFIHLAVELTCLQIIKDGQLYLNLVALTILVVALNSNFTILEIV